MKSTILVSLLLLQFGPGTRAIPSCLGASAPTESKSQWQYRTSVLHGTFTEEECGKWTERVRTGEVYRFVEVERCIDYVEIHDAARDVTIRLHARLSTIRRGGPQEEFQLFCKGHWDRVEP